MRADEREGVCSQASRRLNPPGPRRFFFVRHGETAWNREGRLQGHHDAMLNPLGRSQAGAAGRILAALLAARALPAAGRAFVCSPLTRARDTMDLVRAELGGPLPAVRLDDRAREIGFGSWEGRTWEDLKRREPALMAERRRDTWNFVPPGGGESYRMLLDRLRPSLAEIPDDAVVVAHGGVARALLHGIAGRAPERAVREEIHQGRVLLFEGGEARWA